LADLSLSALIGVLVFLIFLSAFFSASETAMMALNRYRLRHLAKTGNKGARIASTLLERPDRLLGVILLGNNLVNFAAATIAGLIAFKLFGEITLLLVTVPLTITVLIFAEVGPKTVAVLYPERIAFPAAFILLPLLKLGYPVVWIINTVTNFFLRFVGISLKQRKERLSTDELRTVVKEAGAMIPATHQSMLLRILDMEKIEVEDIMVPRSTIEGINIDDDWDEVVTQLSTSHHTRLPVFRGSLDKIEGVLHLRKILHLTQANNFNKDSLIKLLSEPYFIPEGAPITQQLLNMQKDKQRFGLVVDEYGDIKGLVTLDEILEEIVGEFNTQAPGTGDEILPQDDSSYLISGGSSVRDINRKLGWKLPIDGPKTLNGLILEYLEDIPEAGTSLMLEGHPVEIIQAKGTAVKMAKIMPIADKTVEYEE